MEIVSGAGSAQKLYYAYLYGADAAYIGIPSFSLRAKADNFTEEDVEAVNTLRKNFPQKKLYCALNTIFFDCDIARLERSLPLLEGFDFDAFIIQDLGVVEFLQKHFPKAKLHLSTQASVVNSQAAKFYKRLGFSRIVLGREASLSDIATIKDACDIELECFVHGSMCIAYSGRCLMSAYLTGRSAQKGLCTHSCRWDYKVLSSADENRNFGDDLFFVEEKERGELFPVVNSSGDEHMTQIFSSKDLCMVEHLADFARAGVDALKLEGRMKSVYYTALTAQAYHKALDALEGVITQDEAAPFIAELFKTRHREFSTGFYYDKNLADAVTTGSTKGQYTFIASVDQGVPTFYNNIKEGESVQMLSPGELAKPFNGDYGSCPVGTLLRRFDGEPL